MRYPWEYNPHTYDAEAEHLVRETGFTWQELFRLTDTSRIATSSALRAAVARWKNMSAAEKEARLALLLLSE